MMMFKKILLCASLMALLVLGHQVHAQAATCTNGASGVSPTANITFAAPTLNTDGTAVAGPVSYNLYQSTTTGTETKVSSALKGTTITVTTGLAPKTTVYFKVSVVDANGTESALSNEVCKTFPASVPGIVTITVS